MADADTQQTQRNWDSRWETNVYGRHRQINRYPFEQVVSFAMSRWRPGERPSVNVLEVGFGAGNNLWFLAREGFRVCGVEGSPSAVAIARERLAGDGLQGDLRQGDFTRLPWPSSSFDFVLDRGSITNGTRASVAAALDEVVRVLRPGGLLFSDILSDQHSDLRHGRPNGDGSYEAFADGYFADLGPTFFASRRDIDALYGSRFLIRSLHHVAEADVLDGPAPSSCYASWLVIAEAAEAS